MKSIRATVKKLRTRVQGRGHKLYMEITFLFIAYKAI